MILQARNGDCTVLDVLVQLDASPLQATLKTVMPGETGIVVETTGDSIVLSGEVSNALAAEQVASLAESYVIRTARNLDAISASTGQGTSISVGQGDERTRARSLIVNMMSVAAPQQVMLEVKVAEVSKTVLDQFGINFSRAFALGDGSAIRYLSGLLGGERIVGGTISDILSTVDVERAEGNAIVRGTEIRPGFGSVGLGAVGEVQNNSTSGAFSLPPGEGSRDRIPLARGKSATQIGVDAQKQDGLVKVLAEPTVMAISGQEGSFLAGGKIFIPVIQNAGGALVTYTLEEKEFGVSLKFRPTVLADGRINLEVQPEVSELANTGVTITSSVTGGTTVLPAFTTRKAATTVQLFDGQSFAIGGLMKNNVTGNVNAFPFLGELPIIGALFRSTSFQTDRSELVFVITPRLVKPLPPDYVLPTDKYIEPTRSDVILRGKLEGEPIASDEESTPVAAKPAGAGNSRLGGFELDFENP
ncbi:MAG: type II and III secretion system protein family protein [Rhodocyclaceae bacterium]|nr:type II and III secretion system protein family protein [Rhodocyclaceae bacterium]